MVFYSSHALVSLQTNDRKISKNQTLPENVFKDGERPDDESAEGSITDTKKAVFKGQERKEGSSGLSLSRSWSYGI